eukprot:TRINITY_DN6017_c0_g1_i2.p1 TRINITY_DN6017_c0_g1~~TRINITY_DN6017_c0_g1_i2.p1  ORF type:complete len:171 (-),score=4.96 TRINITY_DN6017_c0_g1_i2:35-499(-)
MSTPPKRIDQWGRSGTGRAVLTGYVLGAALGVGIGLAWYSPSLFDLGLFLAALSIYHFWEYNYVAIYRPNELSWTAFLLDQSPAFQMAMLASFIEYFIEWFFFPSLKGHSWITALGFVGVIIGQVMRTLAMATAGHNFNRIEGKIGKDVLNSIS